jgi:septum formation protein
MSSFDLFLASASPRRQELLTQLGYRFKLVLPNVVECRQINESPSDYVIRLSQEKAQAGLALTTGDCPVIGADTIVVVDEKILEKPLDQADSSRMLKLLSGRKHQVLTAVSFVTQKKQETKLVTTQVWFRPLTDDDILAYWQTGEPCDKAGSYGIQGIGGKFIERIDGSYYAVMGLPLVETDVMAKRFLGL